MRRCADCSVDVEGGWERCPLCGAAVQGEPRDAVPSPFPAIPLAYSRRKLLRTLFAVSIAMILLSFATQLFFNPDAPIGALRSVWLGIASMWLVVLMAVRKRRNLAKSTVYLVVLAGLVCAYWDYLTGWHGWSLSYAIPIVCGSAIIALLITVRLMRIEVGEHIVYTGLAVLLGLVPIVFLVFGWADQRLPSAICGALSLLSLVMLQATRGAEVRHELAKRLHL